jgi:membrane protein
MASRVQEQVRAAERQAPGRGREATRASDVPPRGWWDVLRRTIREVRDDDVSTIAASVAFYSLLALFPALIALVSVYGLAADPRDVGEQLRSFTRALPRDARQLVTDQLTSITRRSDGGLGTAAVIGIAAALWSAAGGVAALIKGLNKVYDERETRRFLRLRGLALLLTVGGVVVAIAMVGLIAAAPAVARRILGSGTAATTVVLLRWPLLALLILVALAVLYRFAPDREKPKWRWVSWGAIVAATIWLVASVGFSIYVDVLGSYNETYGSLGAVVVLMLWLYLAALAVLFGAELNAELERQTARDTTTGAERPLGERDAYAADTLGETAHR